MKNKKKKQILVIVWKWAFLAQVNERFFSPERIGELVGNIHEGRANGKDKFYEIYPVESTKEHAAGEVVCINIHNDLIGGTTVSLLDAVLNIYAEEDSDLIVLLHQRHGYNENSISRILQFPQVIKCFLFTGERDYIYYSAQQGGLIDGEGNFFTGRDSNSGEKIKILIKNKVDDHGQISRKYYNRTWTHYNLESEMKVLKLKEEIMDALFPLYMSSEKGYLSSHDLAIAINSLQSRLLNIRIKSFIGYYQVVNKIDLEKNFDEYAELKTELEQLENLESTDKISYDFNDCIPYFDHVNQQFLIGPVYQNCKFILNNLFFQENDAMVDKTDIINLSDQLSQLVKVIPGEID